ncbi:MAG: LysR family transcriptional regulator [Rhodobacteraceae bacterium GWE1_64_9]|nr:MAG: LysR family transcriptional regulator [Rhodobacteraceae bacterium GWE1_64_9]OHC48390.1 MAG: LysR family transcriptional regulator [Rhodobacteraceae bacterium GWF1_65_7]HBD92030.1 LysR family transcriptional regulator [Gemmobacter sp.]HBU13563.1 LysR family transcriptional regulator [Gemmobacter sp.]
MNLRALDLNLLVILDALLDEAHVSRAADRLNLSQPAASAALQRCRHLFRDDLLERGRGTMRLTPRAEALRAPLKSLLAGVTDLVDPAEPPLAELRQTLRIAMADFPALLVIGPLQRALRSTAPGLDLVIQPWHGAEAARSALVAGTTDLAISVFPTEDAEIDRQALLTEHYVIALRPGHPALAGFDLQGWLAFPHILVSGRGDSRSPLDGVLARLGLARRVGLVVPSFGMVPDLLRGSDMIAMLPSRILTVAPDLASLPVPIEVAGFTLHLAWHRRRAKDTGLRHVAAQLARLLA